MTDRENSDPTRLKPITDTELLIRAKDLSDKLDPKEA